MSQRNKNIIRHYKIWKANNPDTCIVHCGSQQKLEDAIRQAALSRDQNGKKHQHQYRLQNQTLQLFSDNLIYNINSILTATSFEQLIEAVRASKIPGIGELAIYDTAVRIGAFMNIWPERVYLHAGAKVGAAAILGSEPGDTISKTDLPAEFRIPDLSCYELEDMLCIYKKMFIHARSRGAFG